MNYVIKTDDQNTSDLGSVRVTTILDSADCPHISVNKVEVTGEQRPGYDQQSDMAYYVLKGEGTFTIDGNEYSVCEGDLVYIPKGTTYHDTAGLTLLAIATPRFDPKQRVRS